MSARRLRFCWIDDDLRRVENHRATIENSTFRRRRALLDSKPVDAKVLEMLREVESRSPPYDLILMDHVFRVAKHLPLELNGATAANLLRSVAPRTPIVCVTALLPDKAGKLDQEQLSEYCKVFAYGAVSDDVEELFAIALDFPKLRVQRVDYRRQIVGRLLPPPSEIDMLTAALPNEFAAKVHAPTQHRVSYWILNVFLERPGFLYGPLHAATLLGLTEAGFNKVEGLFRSARYKGVFATDHRPRWWVRSLYAIAFARSQSERPPTPQQAGRQLPGIVPEDYSVCYVTGAAGEIPDVVARIPGGGFQPVAARHTVADPEDPSTPAGFEASLVLAEGNP